MIYTITWRIIFGMSDSVLNIVSVLQRFRRALALRDSSVVSLAGLNQQINSDSIIRVLSIVDVTLGH